MWFQNNDLKLYWIKNQLSAWIIMLRKPNTIDIFPEEFVFKEMVKISICTRQCGVKEVYNWQTLEPIMVRKMQ